MAQLTLKELLESGTTDAPMVDPVKKDNILGIKGGIGKQITDVISADTSAGGPRMEFYKNLPSLYSLYASPYLSTRISYSLLSRRR